MHDSFKTSFWNFNCGKWTLVLMPAKAVKITAKKKLIQKMGYAHLLAWLGLFVSTSSTQGMSPQYLITRAINTCHCAQNVTSSKDSIASLLHLLSISNKVQKHQSSVKWHCKENIWDFETVSQKEFGEYIQFLDFFYHTCHFTPRSLAFYAWKM